MQSQLTNETQSVTSVEEQSNLPDDDSSSSWSGYTPSDFPNSRRTNSETLDDPRNQTIEEYCKEEAEIQNSNPHALSLVVNQNAAPESRPAIETMDDGRSTSIAPLIAPLIDVAERRSRDNSIDDATVVASHGNWRGHETGDMGMNCPRQGSQVPPSPAVKKEAWDPSNSTVEDEPTKRMHEMTDVQIKEYTKTWSKKKLAEDLPVLHSLHVSPIQRGAQDCKVIGRRLRMTPSLSSSLGRRHVNMLAARFILYMYRNGEEIFAQGDVGDMFYIVFDGTVNIIVDGTNVARLSKTESFGDTALRTQQPRSGSAMAEGDVILMGLTAFNFQTILQRFNRERDEKCVTFLRTHCRFLKAWPEFRVKVLIHQGHHQEYKKGHRIWNQDDLAETVAVILDGDIALEREITRTLSNRWPVRVGSPQSKKSRASLQGRESLLSPVQNPPRLLLSEDGASENSWTLAPLRIDTSSTSPSETIMASTLMRTTTNTSMATTSTTNEANTPRGIHHENVRERLERHRQRLCVPGELLGEELLCGVTKRPYTAVVLSNRATVLVLNVKEAAHFFRNEIKSITEFSAKFATTDEGIEAKLSAHKIKEALRKQSCGDKYLRRKKQATSGDLPILDDNGRARKQWSLA